MEATFMYFVPVYVTVKDGRVVSVSVDDCEPVQDPAFSHGDEAYFPKCVEDAEDGQSWPAWEFGF